MTKNLASFAILITLLDASCKKKSKNGKNDLQSERIKASVDANASSDISETCTDAKIQSGTIAELKCGSKTILVDLNDPKDKIEYLTQLIDFRINDWSYERRTADTYEFTEPFAVGTALKFNLITKKLDDLGVKLASIRWLLNGNEIGIGPSLPLPSLEEGAHEFNVILVDSASHEFKAKLKLTVKANQKLPLLVGEVTTDLIAEAIKNPPSPSTRPSVMTENEIHFSDGNVAYLMPPSYIPTPDDTPMTIANLSSFEKVVNFRNRMTPVKNQGQRGTCVAFAITAAVEYLQKVRENLEYPNEKYSSNLWVDLSEQYFYFQNKYASSTPNEDGLNVRESISKMFEGTPKQKFVTENNWVYNKIGIKKGVDTCSSYNSVTNQGCSATAHQGIKAGNSFVADPHALAAYGIATYGQRVDTGRKFDQIKSMLDQGFPVVASVAVASTWSDPIANKSGLILFKGAKCKEPEKSLSLSDVINKSNCAGHAITLTGYIENSSNKEFDAEGGGFFIAKNSWGTSYGDRGYIYLSYKYMQYFLTDSTTLVAINPTWVVPEKNDQSLNLTSITYPTDTITKSQAYILNESDFQVFYQFRIGSKITPSTIWVKAYTQYFGADGVELGESTPLNTEWDADDYTLAIYRKGKLEPAPNLAKKMKVYLEIYAVPEKQSTYASVKKELAIDLEK